ncbi:MAG TPA: hypothetical protein VGQ83_39295 [Polyangia bacterium]
MLSEAGSLIVPVARALVDGLSRTSGGLPELLALGRVPLWRKEEHHVTVLNYVIGRLILRAIEGRPSLRDEVGALAAAHEWGVRPLGAYYHLVHAAPGRPRRQTIIVLAQAAVGAFYARLREHVAAVALPESAALLEALAWPPPPHVTLYTSDPDGRAAIGLNRVAELEAAISRAREPAADGGLRAYPLHPDVVCGDAPPTAPSAS